MIPINKYKTKGDFHKMQGALFLKTKDELIEEQKRHCAQFTFNKINKKMINREKMKRERNSKKCIKCGNYKKKCCILNHDMHLKQFCEDFTPNPDLSKEELIELWKDIQGKLNRKLYQKISFEHFFCLSGTMHSL